MNRMQAKSKMESTEKKNRGSNIVLWIIRRHNSKLLLLFKKDVRIFGDKISNKTWYINTLTHLSKKYVDSQLKIIEINLLWDKQC